MKKTIGLAAAIIIPYLVLSVKFLYIPTSYLLMLGFNWQNLLGLLTYSFMHISPSHLIGNIVLLLSVGFIAETKLSTKEYFGVYFTAGIVSALVYGVMFPENYLVGASAAISALLAVAFIIDIKKAFVSIIIASIVISFASPVLQAVTKSEFEKLQNKTSEITEKVTELNKQIQEAKQKNLTEQAEVLEKQKQEQVNELNKTSIQQIVIDEGIEREEKAKTSPLVHLAGAFTGLGYVFIFRRELVWQLPSQIMPRKK